MQVNRTGAWNRERGAESGERGAESGERGAGSRLNSPISIITHAFASPRRGLGCVTWICLLLWRRSQIPGAERAGVDHEVVLRCVLRLLFPHPRFAYPLPGEGLGPPLRGTSLHGWKLILKTTYWSCRARLGAPRTLDYVTISCPQSADINNHTHIGGLEVRYTLVNRNIQHLQSRLTTAHGTACQP